MNDSINFRKDRKILVVGWYHKPYGKQYAFYRYSDEFMLIIEKWLKNVCLLSKLKTIPGKAGLM